MLANAEPEVAGIREVLLAEFVFFDLEATLEDLFGFGAADRDVHGDLLVTSDAEGADCVAGFAWGWALVSEFRVSLAGLGTGNGM